MATETTADCRCDQRAQNAAGYFAHSPRATIPKMRPVTVAPGFACLACTGGSQKASPADEPCRRALGPTPRLASLTTVGDVRNLSVGPTQGLHYDAFAGVRATEPAAWCWDGPRTAPDGRSEYDVRTAGPNGTSVLFGYPGQIDQTGLPFFPPARLANESRRLRLSDTRSTRDVTALPVQD